MNSSSNESALAQLRLKWILAALLGGILALILVGLGLALIFRGVPIPPMDAERFAAAEELWRAAGPDHYVIEIRVEGMQPAVYRVTVRGGQAIDATLNGNPLRDLRTLGTWSIPGMFGTIRRDVDTLQAAAKAKEPEPLYLCAEFDSEFGFPRRYLRSDLRFRITTSWEVLQFEWDEQEELQE